MTFKELVNKVRNLVLEAKKVTIEDTDNNFTSDNVEDALKEVFQNGVNVKNNVVTALASKGADVTTSGTWEDIKNKIDNATGRLDLNLITTNLGTYDLVSNGEFDFSKDTTDEIRRIFENEGNTYILYSKQIIKLDEDFKVIYKIESTTLESELACYFIYVDDYLYVYSTRYVYKINKNTGIVEATMGALGVSNDCDVCKDENILYNNRGSEIVAIDANTMLLSHKRDFSSAIYADGDPKGLVVFGGYLYNLAYSEINTLRLYRINKDLAGISAMLTLPSGLWHARRLMVLNDYLYITNSKDTSTNYTVIAYDYSISPVYSYTTSQKRIYEIDSDGEHVYVYCEFGESTSGKEATGSILKFNKDLTFIQEYIVKQDSKPNNANPNFQKVGNKIIAVRKDKKTMETLINYKGIYLPKEGEAF